MVIYYQWSSPLRRGKIYILRLVHVVRCKIFWLTSFFCVGVFDFYKGKGISSLWFNSKVKTDDKGETAKPLIF